MRLLNTVMALIGLLGLAPQIQAEPSSEFPVLKVSKGTKSIILIGSNHTAPSTVYGDTAEKVLSGSKALCMEATPSEKVAAAQAVRATMFNTSGQTLAQRHGQELAEEVTRALAWNKFIADRINNFSDQALGTFLWLLPPGPQDRPLPQMSPNNSVDARLLKLAEQQHLKLVSIEDLDAIPKAASAISKTEWEDYLRKSVEFSKCKDCVQEFAKRTVLQYSLSSDYEASYREVRNAFGSNEKLFDYFDRINLRARNPGLARNINVRAIDGSECDVVAIGAAHLGGPNGVILLLRKMGLIVQPFPLANDGK